ncbi:hypothetical protein [Streptosporangium sandarakinum]|uniref:hypothetical protein n=1 Tax=Streptosporangium sandarakinum TaxID=1260955 RepID=UPI0033AA70F3
MVLTVSESEKITINVGVVDLGKIDLMVEEGFYATRADFIRTAVRNQLDRHENELRQSTSRRSMTIGILVYTRQELEAIKEKGERLNVSVVGMLIISDDVPPDLAFDTIESIKVSGILRASPAVKSALADRIR